VDPGRESLGGEGAPHAGSGAPAPSEDGDRIALLLEELKGMAGPSTWARIEELVRRILRVHGEGLRRLLELAVGSGPVDPALAKRLLGDELVNSLLLLHGLHPAPVAERVSRALEGVHDRLGDGTSLELTGIDGSGVVHLRVETRADQRCGFSAAALRRAVEQAVLEAAPEVVRVDIQGVSAPPPPERLVTLGRTGADRVAR
jgi:Fe-S cluster biogenesis protein NfuA